MLLQALMLQLTTYSCLKILILQFYKQKKIFFFFFSVCFLLEFILLLNFFNWNANFVSVTVMKLNCDTLLVVSMPNYYKNIQIKCSHVSDSNTFVCKLHIIHKASTHSFSYFLCVVVDLVFVRKALNVSIKFSCRSLIKTYIISIN